MQSRNLSVSETEQQFAKTSICEKDDGANANDGGNEAESS
jgi:hypothetical protein